LQFTKYAAAALVPAAQAHNGGEIKNSGMLGNDTLGDCAEAAAGHAEECWYDRDSGGQLALTDAQAIFMYSAVTGYVPGNPNTDQGTVLLDLLTDWRKQAFYTSAIDAFVEIDPTDTTQHQLAIDLFGISYIGLELPDSVLPTDAGIVPFTVDPATGGANAPNPDNGHCIILSGYVKSEDMFWGMTWDTIIPVSGAFVRGCCDEAYGILSPQWTARKGKSPNGFATTQLLADLAVITAA
jgi:hypothetical protein